MMPGRGSRESTPAHKGLLRDETLVLRHFLGYDDIDSPSSLLPKGLGNKLQRSPLRDVLFVGLDIDTFQGYERLIADQQLHIGVSILDARILEDMLLEPTTAQYQDAITSYQFTVGESAYCKRASKKFLFGSSQPIAIAELGPRINDLLSQRDFILVLHGTNSDLKILRHLEIDIPDRSLYVVDTNKAAQYPLQLWYRYGLEKLLETLHIPFANLHAAGNDAHYCLRALLMIAVTDAERRLSGHSASAIAFLQLGVSLAKLVQLWRELDDVPDDLQDALEQLELLQPMLNYIKCEFEQRPQLAALPSAKQCVKYAITASQNVKTLAKKFQDDIKSKKGRLGKKFGMLKVAFREDEVVKLQKRLDRALKVLGLCVDCYRLAVDQTSDDRIIKDTSSMVLSRTQTLVEASEDRIVRRVTLELTSQFGKNEENATFKKPVDKKESAKEGVYTVVKSHHCGVKLASYTPSALGKILFNSSRSAGYWQMFLQAPSWMSRDAWSWEFMAQRAVAGWTFALRSYSIRPEDSQIFKVVRDGEVSEMLSLFRSGEASPYDRDSKGASLLHYATESWQIDTSRTLLELGLTDSMDEHHPGRERSPLDELVFSHADKSSYDKDHRLLDLFLEYRSSIDSIEIPKLFDYLGDWSIDDDCLRAFQGWFMPEYHGLPLRVRAEAVRRACFSEVQSSNTVRFLLDSNTKQGISRGVIDSSAKSGLSIVHSVALALGRRCALDVLPSYQKSSIWGRLFNMNWEYLIGSVVMATSEKVLHGVETVEPCYDFDVAPWRGSPLISVVGGTLCQMRSSARSVHNHLDLVLQGTLRSWLSELNECGIDLLKYGMREKEVFASSQGTFDADSVARHQRWMKNEWCRPELRSVSIRLTALTYGSEITDWRVWWAPEYEVLAAEFWEAVDNPPEIMPGSWLD
ncbi:hypothetical protein CkaCkLH20_05595 [Colletotrichum karsti]|uniref:Gfd2/YDR514C-like C-terminal domain-containing protein n=1 Tax=Colletotrichum karsti TaxID=1095194 RepID=A0A9P6LHX6_9PEZI|nr:uncharacterized protein CkaCkLH20_05595 [Colletotrichum karsti]KAF9876749.1 hypothetical protein CkaCkLH20_05595 [Colletotrichum karsti]